MYSERRPDPKRVTWPEGARMAVLFTFDYQAEEGAPTLPDGGVNYQEFTERQYGRIGGIWRILGILDKHQVKATFLTCGATAEKAPESVQEIRRRGHDLGGHTYHHEDVWKLNRDQEREVFEKTVAAIEKVAGVRIRGWRCPMVRPSENTLELMREFGMAWHSDFLNGDLPYIVEVPGKGDLVEIPYSFSTDDACWYGMPGQLPYGVAPRDLLGIWQDEFSVLYEESFREPRMLIICMHPLLTGRPSRAKILDEFIGQIKNYQGLWFATCGQVADWWLKNGF